MKVSLPAPPPAPPLAAPPPDEAPALASVPPSVPSPPGVVITGAATSALAEASSSLSSSLQQGPAILDWARDWVGASSSSSFDDEEEEHDSCSDEDDDDCFSHFGNGHNGDDETISDSKQQQREEEEEEEHETAAVKALVQAAFDGTLAKPVLQRLLGRSSNSNNPAASRRKNSSCLSFLPSSSSKHARPAAEEATQKQQQQHQPPRKRIRRVRVQVHPDSSSSSSSNSTSNSNKTNMLTLNKLMTPQQLQAALRVSQSAPALVHLNDTDKKHRLQKQPSPSSSPPTTTMTMKPDDLLQSLVESAGYTYQTVPALDVQDFFVPVTAESVADYDLELLTAIRSENVPALQQLLAAGKNMQCSNRFGESVVHTACRRGSARVLQFLLQTARISCKVVCTAGRTALHDALWTSQPNFSVVDMILEACPDLLYVTDQRGFTALQYIRPNQCTAWCDYLRAKAAISTTDNTTAGGGIQQLLPRDLFREQTHTQESTSSSRGRNKP